MSAPLFAADKTVNTNGKGWTNQNKTITVVSDETAKQLGVDGVTQYDQSGIKTIAVGSSGGVVNSTGTTPAVGTKTVTTKVIVKANGKYTVTSTDQAGNATVTEATVNNIDKTKPTATLAASSTAWTNKPVTLSGTVTDAGDTTTYGVANSLYSGVIRIVSQTQA